MTDITNRDTWTTEFISNYVGLRAPGEKLSQQEREAIILTIIEDLLLHDHNIREFTRDERKDYAHDLVAFTASVLRGEF